MDKQVLPFTINAEMLDYVANIMEHLGQLSSLNELEKLPSLRKVSRIQSIHSSLAIENNTLSVEQVTDVINGKRVLGDKGDVKAVQNAIKAYEKLDKINPYNIKDLLETHGIMMENLVSEAGKIRTGEVGVFNEKGVNIYLAPPADLVPAEIENLFNWIKNDKTNMLIKSSVFHYEFEFIHPFRDGNGRMGRLWQTALLASWKPIFRWIPIESIIKDNQEEYYKAISKSTSEGCSDEFILFMLNVIDKAVKNMVEDSESHIKHLNNRVEALLSALETYPQTTQELMDRLKLKSREGFRRNYLKPAIEGGLVKLTEPDKPTSRNQRYFK